MIKKIYYTISLFAALFAMGCNESLEDTYDEYSGNGMIRYLGKCSDVEVNPGWERLRVIWKNNIDAGVKRVKITWQSENEETPYVRYVDRSDAANKEDLMDTIYLENLTDVMYTVRVSNVASDSTESLVEEKYGRPYTANHEDLRTFTRGISSFSRMGDKLAVVLDQDNENVKELLFCYKDTEGREHTWDMKEHMNDTLSYVQWGSTIKLGRDYLFLLPEESGVKIDFSQPLTIKRRGKLTGCVDEIEFNDEELNMNERLWSTAFSQLMLGTYGPNWENEVDRVETLELDYNLLSMQDLMYFPNLKKVIFGKNRYILSQFVNSFTSTTDQYVGLVTLQFLKDTRENFVMERYNNHYFGKNEMGSTYIKVYQDAGKLGNDFSLVEKGITNLEQKPVYTPIDTTGWIVTCSDTLHNGYKDNGAAWLLFDGPRRVVVDWGGGYTEEYDEEVYFEPSQTLGASVVTVTFDMKGAQTVQGFKVGQPTRNQKGDTEFLLSSMKIEFSTDGYSWTNATYTDGSATIGNSPGEETFIPVPVDLQNPVRYIRLSMSSLSVSTISGIGVFNLRLGKFIPCTVQ